MDYITQYYFAQQRFFLEQAAFLVSCFKAGYASSASFEKFIETFDCNRKGLLPVLNSFADYALANNISVPKQ